jgi:hypothetical protein
MKKGHLNNKQRKEIFSFVCEGRVFHGKDGTLKIRHSGSHPATWEVEVGRIPVLGQARQKIKAPSQSINWAWWCSL